MNWMVGLLLTFFSVSAFSANCREGLNFAIEVQFPSEGRRITVDEQGNIHYDKGRLPFQIWRQKSSKDIEDDQFAWRYLTPEQVESYYVRNRLREFETKGRLSFGLANYKGTDFWLPLLDSYQPVSTLGHYVRLSYELRGWDGLRGITYVLARIGDQIIPIASHSSVNHIDMLYPLVRGNEEMDFVGGSWFTLEVKMNENGGRIQKMVIAHGDTTMSHRGDRQVKARMVSIPDLDVGEIIKAELNEAFRDLLDTEVGFRTKLGPID